MELAAHDYALSRFIMERFIAVIYLIAFIVARNQFRALLGERGLQPVPAFVAATRFRSAPSIFHWHYSDTFFAVLCWVGMALSLSVMTGVVDAGPSWAPTLVWLAVWVLYLSIVNVGQTFYSFGWESILLEAGFLAMLFGPTRAAPPTLAIWLARWLVFRIEFGAGLIKMRGDACWRDLTCLYYHHETQPLPNPLSWYFHALPKVLHRIEVAGNHFAQLVVPFGLFAPQPVAAVAGAIIVVTQSWLVLSGNFSWLNVVTIAMAFSAFDDRALGLLGGMPSPIADTPGWLLVLASAVALLTVLLSYWPVRNMLSPSQIMNFSFNNLHLVNTYGAFGSISREREEIVIEGTDSAAEPFAWKEYELKGKPGDPKRRPPQVAPYHLRLDWMMWFVPFSPRYARGWFNAFLARLLENDATTLALLRKNPFPHSPPTYVRVLLYRYRFTTWRERRETGAYWVRTLVREYLPPLSSSEAAAGFPLASRRGS